MRLALTLISQGFSNKAVAADLDFADESHFCHEFKRVYGVPPQAFGPVYGARYYNEGKGLRLSGRVADHVAFKQECRV